ncbi:uncharacterized protein K02A2.6-like [Acropora millepora]|uniref:uncharacterized protein K02A2.6-like n=1 Tax=Acropora millepora TaxID=45264 RepID=UPI001CF320AF|nr:uncharacterized protein K02A2.6-like [Acropora millepora]
MALVGQVGEYVDGKEDIASYIERIELYFAANYVEKDNEVVTLLAVIGADAYGILRNLLAPQRPKDKSFDELKEVLIGHYSPKPILIAERFKFHRRNQLESESIAQFVVELKRLALRCEFGTFLEEALRDRLVYELKNIHIQKKLLAERELTFKKAFETAQSMELANKEDMRDVITTGDESVNKVDKVATLRRPQRESGNCFRCGQKHAPSGCWCKTAQCYSCKKKGHIAKMCNQKYDAHNTRYVEDVSQSASADDDMCGLGLYTLTSADQRRSAPAIEANTFFYLKTYSGERLTLLGEFQVRVTYQTREVHLPLVVAKGDKPVLRNWLDKLKLDWATIFKVSEVNAVEGLIAKYQDLFEKGYGHLKQFKASIQVREDAKPVFLKARPVPYALKEKVEQELQRLEEEGIIYKVSQSDWAAPVVSVPKKDGTLRVCGDYKMTVNRCADVDQYPLPNAEDLFATLSGGKIFSKIDLSHAYQQVELDDNSQK